MTLNLRPRSLVITGGITALLCVALGGLYAMPHKSHHGAPCDHGVAELHSWNLAKAQKEGASSAERNVPRHSSCFWGGFW